MILGIKKCGRQEKAYEIDSEDLDSIRTLMSLNENVEMEEKYKELKAIYDNLK